MKIKGFVFIIAGLSLLAGVAYGAEEAKSSSKKLSLTKPKVIFKLNTQRDPMLSPDDILLLRAREQQRLAAEAAQRRQMAEEERKRQEEAERRRQEELALLKDPTILVRKKIRIGGIIDKEVLIGGKLYTIGNTYLGAKIIKVTPEKVTFSYKGRTFDKKVPL